MSANLVLIMLLIVYGSESIYSMNGNSPEIRPLNLGNRPRAGSSSLVRAPRQTGGSVSADPSPRKPGEEPSPRASVSAGASPRNPAEASGSEISPREASELWQNSPLRAKLTSAQRKLFEAAEIGSIELATVALSQGVSLYDSDGVGRLALHIAVRQHQTEFVKWLLQQIKLQEPFESEAENGTAICVGWRNAKRSEYCNYFTVGGYAALHIATSMSYRDLMVLLLNFGASPNALSEPQNTLSRAPLHMAISHRDIETAAILLGHEADINLTAGDGRTPLHYAVAGGHLDDVEFLLRYQPNIDAIDKNGASPLYLAQCLGFEDIIQLLIDRGAKLLGHEPAIIVAARWNKIEQIRQAIEHCPALLSIMNQRGQTLLHIAAQYGYFELVQYLIAEMKQHGFGFDAPDLMGRTAFHYAAAGGFKEIVELMMAEGVDANAQDVAGDTAFHLAIRNCRFPVVDAMYSSVNRHLINAAGEAPLHNSYLLTGQSASNSVIWGSRLRSIARQLVFDGALAHLDCKLSLLFQAIYNLDQRMIKKILLWDVGGLLVDDNGNTPLHMIASMGIPSRGNDASRNEKSRELEVKSIMRLLMQSNPSICQNRSGLTPLDILAARDCVGLLGILIGDRIDLWHSVNGKKETLLHVAAHAGAVVVVEELFRHDVAVNTLDDHGATPLHAAIVARREQVVRLLLAHPKINRDLADGDNDTSLHKAIRSEMPNDVIALCATQKNINQLNSLGLSPLHIAIQKYLAGNERFFGVIESLVKMGAKIDINSSVYNPLAEACRKRQESLFSWLLAHDEYSQAVINELVSLIMSELASKHYALQQTRCEFTRLRDCEKRRKFLVNRIEELRSQPVATAQAYSHFSDFEREQAVKSREESQRFRDQEIELFERELSSVLVPNFEPTEERIRCLTAEIPVIETFLEQLVERDIDILVYDIYGDTLLHQAIRLGNLERLKMLTSDGKKYLNVRNSKGMSLLHTAVECDDVAVIEWLLAEGADLNALDNAGNTPLHQALQSKKTATVELLLNYEGIKFDLLGDHHNLYLHLALFLENLRPDLLVRLVKPSTVYVKNSNGLTPLFLALKLYLAGRVNLLKVIGEILKFDHRGWWHDQQGNSALHLAVRAAANVQLTGLLLNHDAPVNAVDASGDSSLTVVERLLQSIDKNSKDPAVREHLVRLNQIKKLLEARSGICIERVPYATYLVGAYALAGGMKSKL